ncbi:MAG: GerMN domain-containing protein, partial [Pseudomonadota bacterium]
ISLPAFALTAFSQDKIVYSLYFPQRSLPLLGREPKELELGPPLSAGVRTLVSALEAGPKSGSKMTSALPKGVALRQVFLDQAGVVYLDFDLGKSKNLGVGVLEERLFIWSWVNTISLNIPEIKAVKLLVNGGEALTIGGHVDISLPLLPDRSLVE